MESCIDKYSVAPCCLCGSSEHNATYFCALKAAEKSFIERHHGSLPDDRARICKKHQLEAKHGNNIYSIDWEDQDRQETISQSMHQMIKGCKCKKGCNTSRCGCKKKSSYCGPGCYCSSCSNIPTQISHKTEDNGSSESEYSEESSSEESLETEIITDYNFIDFDCDL